MVTKASTFSRYSAGTDSKSMTLYWHPILGPNFLPFGPCILQKCFTSPGVAAELNVIVNVAVSPGSTLFSRGVISITVSSGPCIWISLVPAGIGIFPVFLIVQVLVFYYPGTTTFFTLVNSVT